MHHLIAVYKPKGITPYHLIQQFRTTYPEYEKEKIGFAGRLDPLAHGIMLLMIGNATKERTQYLSLPKWYECEALFGIQTDTYDLLGIIQTNKQESNKRHDTHKIQTFITSKLGKQTQIYPPFSAKTVQGKPLHWWAKKNKLADIIIPTKEIEITQFELLSQKSISREELKKSVKQALTVQGDFRQQAIGEKWEHFFKKNKQQTFHTARFFIECSSGTYVRSLINELGNYLKNDATTLEIFRTKVGDYTLKNMLSL
jgi:tRNA pseudouridine55 synthase